VNEIDMTLTRTLVKKESPVHAFYIPFITLAHPSSPTQAPSRKHRAQFIVTVFFKPERVRQRGHFEYEARPPGRVPGRGPGLSTGKLQATTSPWRRKTPSKFLKTTKEKEGGIARNTISELNVGLRWG